MVYTSMKPRFWKIADSYKWALEVSHYKPVGLEPHVIRDELDSQIDCIWLFY